jgi:hypothetical protein
VERMKLDIALKRRRQTGIGPTSTFTEGRLQVTKVKEFH